MPTLRPLNAPRKVGMSVKGGLTGTHFLRKICLHPHVYCAAHFEVIVVVVVVVVVVALLVDKKEMQFH